MNPKEILELFGWMVECYSPYEIRHKDGSFATLNAAGIVTGFIVKQYEEGIRPDDEEQ